MHKNLLLEAKGFEFGCKYILYLKDQLFLDKILSNEKLQTYLKRGICQ